MRMGIDAATIGPLMDLPDPLADVPLEPADRPDRRQLLTDVIRLALPVILTNMLQSLVNVVDVFMVGRLGPISIAAIGMSTVIRMLVLVLVLTVATGSMSLISQAKGKSSDSLPDFTGATRSMPGFSLETCSW